MKKWRFMLAYSSETKIYSNFHNEIFVPSTCCNICDIAFLRCPFQRMRFIPKNQSNHAKTFFSSVQLALRTASNSRRLISGSSRRAASAVGSEGLPFPLGCPERLGERVVSRRAFSFKQRSGYLRIIPFT